MIRTLTNVMQRYQCCAETAQRYIDLRDEGYSATQAALMAGLSDPPDYSEPAATKEARPNDPLISGGGAEPAGAGGQPTGEMK